MWVFNSLLTGKFSQKIVIMSSDFYFLFLWGVEERGLAQNEICYVTNSLGVMTFSRYR